MTAKIPGVLPPPPKTELDGKIENLHSKSVFELKELLVRQEKLLSNRAFISKLNDKGEKIRLLHKKISEEISSKLNIEGTADLLSTLNIADIEWNKNGKPDVRLQLDSDDDSDDEDDPLKIIAQSSQLRKTVVVQSNEKPLITDADIDTETVPVDEHVKYICKKTSTEDKPIAKYKPYKTTKSDVHDPLKEKLYKRGKFWEVTAATPPPSLHGPVQTLSLQESLFQQIRHTKLLKEVQSKHAAEKLASQLGYKIGEAPKSLLHYRDNQSDTESDTSEANRLEVNSDEEVHDLDDVADRGGVVFPIMK